MKIIDNKELLREKVIEYGVFEFFKGDHEHQMKLIKLQKGDRLFVQDEKIDYFCFFLTGKAKIYRTLSNGKENVVNVIQGFTLLGEVELISGRVSLTSVEVIAPSECILISIDYCCSQLLQDLSFLQKIAYHMANTIHSVDTNLSINLFFPLENRVASYILSSEKENFVSFDLSTLPERLGTTYRHFLRIIKQFQELDIIKKSGKGFIILERKELERKVGDDYFL